MSRLERLAGAVEDDELDPHPEPFRQLAGKIHGDAERLAVRPLLRQHAIALVDGGAKPAGGGEFLDKLGRHWAQGWAFPGMKRSGGDGTSIFAAAC